MTKTAAWPLKPFFLIFWSMFEYYILSYNQRPCGALRKPARPVLTPGLDFLKCIFTSRNFQSVPHLGKNVQHLIKIVIYDKMEITIEFSALENPSELKIGPYHRHFWMEIHLGNFHPPWPQTNLGILPFSRKFLN